jgi:very-short-patch-repair endonuclease
MSFSEAAMWNLLRLQPLRELHFRRQVQIGAYYADFASHSVRLIVEVDGEHHMTDGGIAHDHRRDGFLGSQGYRVLRFWAPDVLRNQSAVFDALMSACGIDIGQAAPHPPPVGGPPSP